MAVINPSDIIQLRPGDRRLVEFTERLHGK
jgi:hypothetical protein